MIYIVEIINTLLPTFEEVFFIQCDKYYPIKFAAEDFIISGCWNKNINTKIIAVCNEKQFCTFDKLIPIFDLIRWKKYLSDNEYSNYIIERAPDKDFIFILAKKKILPYWALSKIKKQITEHYKGT